MLLDVGAMWWPTWTDSQNVVTDVGAIWTDIANDLESLPGMSVPMGHGPWTQSDVGTDVARCLCHVVVDQDRLPECRDRCRYDIDRHR